MEQTIPLFPCKSLAETLAFYGALGFEVTHEQRAPYLYGAVRRDETHLHFANLSVYGAKNAFGATLVFVSDIAHYHRAFAAGLREAYGRVPSAGFPRITRFGRVPTRFKLFDPTGNVLIYIDHREAEIGWEDGSVGEGASEMARALENAEFLRDTYANDTAAARVLDVALLRHGEAETLDRALALAARAELAVALGDASRAAELLSELDALDLSDEDRQRHHPALAAAGELARWVVGG